MCATRDKTERIRPWEGNCTVLKAERQECKYIYTERKWQKKATGKNTYTNAKLRQSSPTPNAVLNAYIFINQSWSR